MSKNVIRDALEDADHPAWQDRRTILGQLRELREAAWAVVDSATPTGVNVSPVDKQALARLRVVLDSGPLGQ